MKLPFKKFIPHSLAFILIASSPLSVLSTTAYANSLEKATKQQENINEASLQEPVQNQVDDTVEIPKEEPPVEEIKTEVPPKESTPSPTNDADENANQPPSSDVIEPSTPQPTPIPPVENTVEEGKEETEEPTVEPSTLESRFEQAKKTMTDAKTYEEKRDFVEKSINAFKKEQTKENLQLAVDYTVLLPYSPTNIYKGDKTYFSGILPSLFEFIKDTKQKEEVLYHLADKSIKQSLITLNHNDLKIAEMAHSMLPEGDKKKANKVELDKAIKKVYAENADPDSGYINWDDPNIDFGEPPSDDNPENWEPDFDPDQYDPPSKVKPLPDDFEEGYSIFTYSIEQGTCYKTTTQYKSDGTFVKKIKDVASNSEKMFCGVQIPDGNSKDYYGDGWNKDLVHNADASPDGSNNPNDPNGAEKDKEAVLNTDTIQYTFEKDSDSPYYYDTGIHVSKENTLTYQQSRDALYQIAVQAKGKFVEDNDRAMALLDGLIILVEDNGKPILVKDFVTLFDETSIGVKAQGTRSGDTYSLVDLIEIKSLITVINNGEKVDLKTNPIVDDGTVLFPVEQFAKSFKGTAISTTEETTTVEYKGNRIAFTDNQSSAKENGKNKDLTVPTRKNQEGVRMVELNALLDFFKSTVEVNSASNEVVIATK